MLNKKKAELSEVSAGLILVFLLIFLGLAIVFFKFKDFKALVMGT
jgi:hypothetical protein